MTRGERIVCLVWSMGDAVATPAGSRDVRRVMATRREACVPCGGSGRLADRFGRPVVCGACGGDGRFWVDGYTGERTGAPGSTVPAEDLVTVRRRVGCSWCQEPLRARWDADQGTWLPVERRSDVLPRGAGVRKGERCWACDGTGWRWVPLELDLPSLGRDGASERVAWRIPGSYRELERCLVDLGRLSRGWRRALLDEGSRGRWPLVSTAATWGLRFVEGRMPARIDVSGDVLAAWRARDERAALIRGPKRDHRIRELVGQGVPPAVVARRAGLSERQVRRIAYERQ